VFKNLGLTIIDEEHRFGVRQKERMKELRAEVDVLTLTATPIPRTLAMSLEGIRDFR
jgi:transcription-repair coupling factor (superfamily II helicase)